MRCSKASTFLAGLRDATWFLVQWLMSALPLSLAKQRFPPSFG
jgi:hypothetical protein